MNPSPCLVEKNSGAFIIEDYLSAAMCQHYIAWSEEMGYVQSEVNFRTGSRRAEEVRNNDRVIFDDPTMAATLFEKARPFLPATIVDWDLVGFNERFRFYRYSPGEYFKWHRDGAFEKTPDERSFLTFIMYLNGGFEGGDTEFKTEFIRPQEGCALVFPHQLPHQGMEVLAGVKYVLRTDVMYRRQT